MKTIITSSVLFQCLDELIVPSCDGQVICGSSNEDDGAVLDEIAFMKLEELTLNNLPRLTSFCQGNHSFNFPSLQKVHLKACFRLRTFCHGNLTTTSHIEVRCLYGWSNDKSEDHWDDDLNTTIRTIFTEEVHINQTSGSQFHFLLLLLRLRINVLFYVVEFIIRIHHQNQTTAECVYH